MRFCEGETLVPEILFTRDAFTSDWNSVTEKITGLKTNTGADDAEQALKLTGNPDPHRNELLFVRPQS